MESVRFVKTCTACSVPVEGLGVGFALDESSPNELSYRQVNKREAGDPSVGPAGRLDADGAEGQRVRPGLGPTGEGDEIRLHRAGMRIHLKVPEEDLCPPARGGS